MRTIKTGVRVILSVFFATPSGPCTTELQRPGINLTIFYSMYNEGINGKADSDPPPQQKVIFAKGGPRSGHQNLATSKGRVSAPQCVVRCVSPGMSSLGATESQIGVAAMRLLLRVYIIIHVL